VRVRVREGRGSRGGLRVQGDDAHGVAEKHAQLHRSSSPHAAVPCMCACAMYAKSMHAWGTQMLSEIVLWRLVSKSRVWRETDGTTPP
jgi:hypothetical protein